MISIETQVPNFSETDISNSVDDNANGESEIIEEEHYYCLGGEHICVKERKAYETRELLTDCEDHGTIMINLVLSDEYIARHLIMDRVGIHG